ncbi:MAG TPA: hypothetical protein VGX28_03675 [Frankiaceae bacterium]|jgi:hypothetical protein|nr:hypothetical protein [Frankiaceae bacterium]
MHALVRPLGLAALAAGTLLAQPAGASTRCVGEQAIFYACVVTPSVGVGSTPLCVYTGGSSCQTVDVPVPVLSGTVGVTCGGALAACGSPALQCAAIDLPPVCY